MYIILIFPIVFNVITFENRCEQSQGTWRWQAVAARFKFYRHISNIKRTKSQNWNVHTGVIKWKHFPRGWPFGLGIHQSPVNSPHEGQWPGALIFYLIFTWINDWVNNREAGDLRHGRAHYKVTLMFSSCLAVNFAQSTKARRKVENKLHLSDQQVYCSGLY